MHLEVYGPTFRLVCPIQDNLNGTYNACCMIDVENNPDPFTISMYVQFVNFKAYENFLGIHELIWNNTFTTNYKKELDPGYRSKVSIA